MFERVQNTIGFPLGVVTLLTAAAPHAHAQVGHSAVQCAPADCGGGGGNSSRHMRDNSLFVRGPFVENEDSLSASAALVSSVEVSNEDLKIVIYECTNRWYVQPFAQSIPDLTGDGIPEVAVLAGIPPTLFANPNDALGDDTPLYDIHAKAIIESFGNTFGEESRETEIENSQWDAADSTTSQFVVQPYSVRAYASDYDMTAALLKSLMSGRPIPFEIVQSMNGQETLRVHMPSGSVELREYRHNAVTIFNGCSGEIIGVIAGSLVSPASGGNHDCDKNAPITLGVREVSDLTSDGVPEIMVARAGWMPGTAPSVWIWLVGALAGVSVAMFIYLQAGPTRGNYAGKLEALGAFFPRKIRETIWEPAAADLVTDFLRRYKCGAGTIERKWRDFCLAHQTCLLFAQSLRAWCVGSLLELFTTIIKRG